MIGPMEKKFSERPLSPVPSKTIEGIDLKSFPKFICYKAALLKEKATLKTTFVVTTILFCVYYAISRHEIATLNTKLREKEFILAPGVVDFTVVSPQAVPEGYVNDAVSDFVSDLGNFTPQNINSQYAAVKRFMADKLKVKFEMETADWIKQVEGDNLSQIFTIKDKEISADKEGNYKATIIGRADFYSNHQYLGYEEQVIEMQMHLTSPQNGKRWYLEISTLTWNKADTFQAKRTLQK